ncbi:chemotaxis protein CheR [Solemya pervernicosa gill symbiont]|uniref:Chemotaxis protein methyltransferase n=2 Tax=Gammaproteobacteria incertae sedis TaxID=118884 RepID=A0A1T2KZ26_9GAMM|nr:chemotaxis protein CheR [Solemya pervernicosa gill symbiont]QKQ28254.1 protein-glutamate O-methyltransferase CheR [Candidatus Reidiella endopervernicosa]
MATNRAADGKEFGFTDQNFHAIQQLVGERTGIVLSDAKRDMVYSRLVRRLRQLGHDSFDSYLEMLGSDPGDEMGHFINAITTNLTSFFRENHHFEFLRETLLPALLEAHKITRRIRIWSAGCSTGEEPYSIAMTVRELIPESSGWDIKILATDLDSNVVATAKRGVYSEDRISGIPKQRLKRWFLRGKGEKSDQVRVRSELRDMISFRQLNLLHDWPFKGPLDFIFCRNVVIYFNKDTQRKLFDRYSRVLAEDGHLFVGHSESLYKVTDRFHLLGNTIYQKAEESKG